jgi:hypothetical protein
VVNFTPRPLYPQGKILWYPSDRRLDGPQSRSARGGEEYNIKIKEIVWMWTGFIWLRIGTSGGLL